MLRKTTALICTSAALTAAACSDPTGSSQVPLAAIVFPSAVEEWREDYPRPWTHFLDANGGCHVEAQMQEGWPMRYGTITIYPLSQSESGEWRQTGQAFMHPATIYALDRMFSPRGYTFYEGTFDALVAVRAINKRGQEQHVESIFRCITAAPEA